ncbi:MAG: tRNA preQ1(34) S-adenosylmethionine ribosyltransferase-isomerase QueA [Desulfotomaculum sp.]|nr:tRNA preQ1(34) S-adenosylmethionine ribosyltransferase-isomerase QueA [Desulfotomaculum sp.]
MALKTAEFNYHLPQQLIAQTPVEPRDSSRLLIMDSRQQELATAQFTAVINWMAAGDVLVMNNTRVIPARIIGKKTTGGKVEVFLLHPLVDNTWEAMISPYPKDGVIILGDNLKVKVLEQTLNNTFVIAFPAADSAVIAMKKWGEVPLPPYIKVALKNPERYQTIFASQDGSTAAPTATLHFTIQLMQKIKQKGIKLAFFTLHMGIGSFRPVKTEFVEEHQLPAEFFHLPAETAAIINQAKKEGRKIIACGTDAVRSLESAAVKNGVVQSSSYRTSLFITPGYQFKIVDRIITNLHLPCSSHLLLISAFAGQDFVLSAYRYAVKNKFRFFSFGDATLII